MFTLPPDLFILLMQFAPLFSTRVLCHGLVLVTGVLLTPGRRTVTNALRLLGRQDDPHFQNFHRVLNRARWSSRQVAGLLLRHLVRVFVPTGVVLLGIDDHLERRQGEQIAARGIYRDAARSSKAYLTKAAGLRWLCLMLLAPITWAQRVWALPFLTVLAPSERYDQERGHRHRTLADHARQMLKQVRRWLPDREIAVVADRSYAVLALLAACQQLRQPIICVTRLRLDAARTGRPGSRARRGARPRRASACRPWKLSSPRPRRSGPASGWRPYGPERGKWRS